MRIDSHPDALDSCAQRRLQDRLCVCVVADIGRIEPQAERCLQRVGQVHDPLVPPSAGRGAFSGRQAGERVSRRYRHQEGGRFGESSVWLVERCGFGSVCVAGDVDRDGSDDLIQFFPIQDPDVNGTVLIVRSTGSSFGSETVAHENFCYRGEVCLSGDFDGDSRADIVTFVRSSKSGEGEGDVFVALAR